MVKQLKLALIPIGAGFIKTPMEEYLTKVATQLLALCKTLEDKY